MGRRQQPKPAGGTFLITNRGTAQTSVFRSDHDRRCFLGLLGQLQKSFEVAVLAYVLMGNHYHLIVRSAGERLAEAMQFLDGAHARRFNASHQRRGALFQGRYDARLLDSEVGLVGAGHYVHLNPVRAGLVADPAAYPWSSMGAYAAGRSPLRWLQLELLAGGTAQTYVNDLRAAHPEFFTPSGAPDDLAVFEAWDDERVTADRFARCDNRVAEQLDVSVDEFYIVAKGRTNVPRLVAIVHAQQKSGEPAAVVASRYGLRRRTGVYAVARRLKCLAEADAGLSRLLSSLDIAV